MFADGALGNVVLSPMPISNGSQFAFLLLSVTDLFTLCCPLLLAVDDADFISNLLLGFKSGSIGLSLECRAADAAGAGSGVAASIVSSHLFFLCSLSVHPQPTPH